MKMMEQEKMIMGKEKWKRLKGSDDIRLGKNSRYERDIDLIIKERGKILINSNE